MRAGVARVTAIAVRAAVGGGNAATGFERESGGEIKVGLRERESESERGWF